jgi:membrane fusion protein (multidrug efflux system)
MTPSRKNTVILLAAICFIVILGICYFLISKHFKNNSKITQAPQTVSKVASGTTPSVQVIKLTAMLTPQVVTTYGTTVSPNTAVVAAKSTGVISGIYFKAGQQIKQGQLLFHIVSNDISEQMQKLTADLANARYTYDSYLQANKEVAGTVSVSDLNKAKAEYTGALSAYQAAKEEVFITAPIDGVAADTNLAVGNSVQVGEQLIAIISSKDLQIKYTLPSQYSGIAKSGQTVTFVPNNSKQKYLAKVVYVSSALNSDTDNLTLRANFTTTVDLDANLFGQVTQVLNASYKAFAVPQAMVQSDEQGFYLYIVQDGKVAKSYITVGQVTASGYVAIQSAWNPNTLVIASDTAALSVGQNVKVQAS